MKLKRLFILNVCFLASFSLFGCAKKGEQPSESQIDYTEEYGTVTIDDVEVGLNERITISPVYSKPAKYEPLSYSYEGENIRIDDSNHLFGLVEGTQTVVTAYSEHFRTTFNATVTIDYGKVKSKDITVYKNYEGVAPDLTFTKPNRAEELTYTFDGNDIKYENGKFVALNINKTVTVTGKSEHFETTFKVSTKEFDFENRVVAYENAWNVNKYKGQTVYLGDSFFDAQFWSNFYTLFAKKDVLQQGISATTVTDWMLFAQRLIYPQEPKEIVMHLGTNDMFDDKLTNTQNLENILLFFGQIYERLPEVKIYYFSVEPRTSALAGTTNARQKAYLDVFNNGVKEYAQTEDRLVYLDSAQYFYDNDGNVIASQTKDGCHPINSLYETVYKKMPLDAGLVLRTARNISYDVADVIRTKEQAVGSSVNVMYAGAALNKNFDLKGTLNIAGLSSAGTNPHIEFRFEAFEYRFLLWDQSASGNLKVSYAFGSYVQSSHLINYTNGLETTFEILASEDSAYLYVNNKLEVCFLNFTWNGFFLGSENIACSFTNMTALTLEDNPTEFGEIMQRSKIVSYEAETTKKVVMDY